MLPAAKAAQKSKAAIIIISIQKSFIEGLKIVTTLVAPAILKLDFFKSILRYEFY